MIVKELKLCIFSLLMFLNGPVDTTITISSAVIGGPRAATAH